MGSESGTVALSGLASRVLVTAIPIYDFEEFVQHILS